MYKSDQKFLRTQNVSKFNQSDKVIFNEKKKRESWKISNSLNNRENLFLYVKRKIQDFSPIFARYKILCAQ